MDLSNGGGGSGKEETYDFQKGKKQHHRHSREQIQQLEEFYKECPHPNDNQRLQLSRELGLDLKQIRFWFQNKRTQTKAHNEKADNNSLQTENEIIHLENHSIQEALKTIQCTSCIGEDAQNKLLQLRMENERLKKEHERAAIFFGNPTLPSPVNLENAPQHPENPIAPPVIEIDESSIFHVALSAINELMYLMNVNEPVWVQAPEEGRYTLHRDSYDMLFPHSNHIKSASARFESSKDSAEVEMAAIHLTEILLDANKWMDTFPTVVNTARSVGVLDTGTLEGSLHLMCEKVHVLSPLVAPREFFFIRYCRKFTPTSWVMVDVSYDLKNELHNATPIHAWKLPSGCLIEDLSNGKSLVTWIEHVQVDDKSLSHRLYKDLVCTSQAYGAKRWITTLQRMCERYAFSMSERYELERDIGTPEQQRNLLKLSHRMMKNFCEALIMPEKRDFSHSSEFRSSGVQISFRISNEPGQLNGFVVCASTSIWFPLPKENLFEFLKDEKNRDKWHVLSGGNPVNAVARISTGTHPGNCISILQPFVAGETNMLMLEESSIDPLGGMIIYAPIDLPSILSAVNGEDTMKIKILPSGLMITSDGREKKTSEASISSNTDNLSGSLLTVAFQILVSHGPLTKELDMELIVNVHAMLSSTIQKIKTALHISDED